MTHHPFKPLLLDLLRHAQISQNAFFQQVPEGERLAGGTPECWSAKDHVAHLTFWRQRLMRRVQAVLGQEPQPPHEDFEQLNPVVFAQHRDRPWSAVLADSDAAYATLIALTDQVTEEDLTAVLPVSGTPEGEPFYSVFMGYCYEHTQQHLAQYALDRQDLAAAIGTFEAWASRVMESEAPDPVKGLISYNLACFYATHDQLEKARPVLQRALTLHPLLEAYAQTDVDLVALRRNSPH